jgi:hypothetical protein
MNKVFWLSAIFAIAVLAGCSSPSLPTTNSPTGHLTGTMSDWTSAVCERGSGPLPMAHGPMLGGAPNPMVCQGLMQASSGTRMRVPVSIGTYTSESLILMIRTPLSPRAPQVSTDRRRAAPGSATSGWGTANAPLRRPERPSG